MVCTKRLKLFMLLHQQDMREIILEAVIFNEKL